MGVVWGERGKEKEKERGSIVGEGGREGREHQSENWHYRHFFFFQLSRVLELSINK